MNAVIQPCHRQVFARGPDFCRIRIELRCIVEGLPRGLIILTSSCHRGRRQHVLDLRPRFSTVGKDFHDSDDHTRQRQNRRCVSNPLHHRREFSRSTFVARTHTSLTEASNFSACSAPSGVSSCLKYTNTSPPAANLATRAFTAACAFAE